MDMQVRRWGSIDELLGYAVACPIAALGTLQLHLDRTTTNRKKREPILPITLLLGDHLYPYT